MDNRYTWISIKYSINIYIRSIFIHNEFLISVRHITNRIDARIEKCTLNTGKGLAGQPWTCCQTPHPNLETVQKQLKSSPQTKVCVADGELPLTEISGPRSGATSGCSLLWGRQRSQASTLKRSSLLLTHSSQVPDIAHASQECISVVFLFIIILLFFDIKD